MDDLYEELQAMKARVMQKCENPRCKRAAVTPDGYCYPCSVGMPNFGKTVHVTTMPSESAAEAQRRSLRA